MIIERARELALRAPARVVFPDALDERVLKAAHYLQQHGLARPILVASPFVLRQFALSHRMALDGIQVIAPPLATCQCAKALRSAGLPAPEKKRRRTRWKSLTTR